VVFQALVGLVIGAAALVHGFSLPDLSHYWVNVVLMVILYGVGNICVFHALKIIEASTFTILLASRALWTIIGALLLLGESYTWLRLAGALLIISSIVLVSWKRRQKLALGKGEVFSLLAALFFGLAFVNDAFIIRGSDVLSYEAIAFVLPTIGILIAQPQAVKKIPHLLRKDSIMKLALLSAFYGVSAVTVFTAYKVGHNAAQIAPLEQTTTIVTVVLSIIFLKEKTALVRKSLGTVLSFVGIMLVG